MCLCHQPNSICSEIRRKYGKLWCVLSERCRHWKNNCCLTRSAVSWRGQPLTLVVRVTQWGMANAAAVKIRAFSTARKLHQATFLLEKGSRVTLSNHCDLEQCQYNKGIQVAELELIGQWPKNIDGSPKPERKHGVPKKSQQNTNISKYIYSTTSSSLQPPSFD